MRFDGAIEPHHGAPPPRAAATAAGGGCSERACIVKCRDQGCQRCANTGANNNNNSNTELAGSGDDDHNNNNSNTKNNNTTNKDDNERGTNLVDGQSNANRRTAPNGKESQPQALDVTVVVPPRGNHSAPAEVEQQGQQQEREEASSHLAVFVRSRKEAAQQEGGTTAAEKATLVDWEMTNDHDSNNNNNYSDNNNNKNKNNKTHATAGEQRRTTKLLSTAAGVAVGASAATSATTTTITTATAMRATAALANAASVVANEEADNDADMDMNGDHRSSAVAISGRGGDNSAAPSCPGSGRSNNWAACTVSGNNCRVDSGGDCGAAEPPSQSTPLAKRAQRSLEMSSSSSSSAGSARGRIGGSARWWLRQLRSLLLGVLVYAAAAMPLTALPSLVRADDDFFGVNSFSVSPDTTTPEFDYASRGQKKFGDKCENTLECGFPGSICDPKKRSCQCTEDLPATNHIDKCGKEAAVNESCFFNEQCEAKLYQTECRDGRCICRYELIPVWAKDGTVSCKGRTDRPTGNETYVDPAMIMVLVGMALMFVIICVVLRLFSQARWRENRTIFNTPNPRLMNVSLLRESKLLHGQERRGSRMSVRGPSRQPSMASLRPHSPNPSLGRMTRSKSNTRSSDSRVSDASNCSRLLEHPHNAHATSHHMPSHSSTAAHGSSAAAHGGGHHGHHHQNNNAHAGQPPTPPQQQQPHHTQHQQQHHQQQQHHHQQPHHHSQQQHPQQPMNANSITTTTTTYVPVSPVGPNTACSISVTTPPPPVVKTNKF